MPVINFESSLGRARLESDRRIGKRITQDCDSEFAGLSGRAK